MSWVVPVGFVCSEDEPPVNVGLTFYQDLMVKG
jgi:hypothetical protein